MTNNHQVLVDKASIKKHCGIVSNVIILVSPIFFTNATMSGLSPSNLWFGDNRKGILFAGQHPLLFAPRKRMKGGGDR